MLLCNDHVSLKRSGGSAFHGGVILYIPVVVFPEHPYELLSTSLNEKLDTTQMRVAFLLLIEWKVLHVSDLLAILLGSRIFRELSENIK